MVNSVPRIKSPAPPIATISGMRPSARSTAQATQNDSFSRTAAGMIGRKRCGSREMIKKATCHAAATPRDAITEKQNTEDQITENQTKPDKRGSNPDGTERAAKRSATVSGSGFPRSPSQDFGCVGDSDNRSGSGQGQVGWAMTGESKSTPPKDAPDLSSLVMDSLVDKWEEVWEHMDCHDESDDLLNDLDKRDMLRDYLEANGCDPKRMLGILSWLPHSNYWGKTLDGQLKGLDGFLKAYRVIGPQYNNYMAQVSARKKKAGA